MAARKARTTADGPANETTWNDLKAIFGARGEASICQGQRYRLQPRDFAGELLFNRPITPNCFVAIGMADGRGQVRQFVRRTHDGIFVRRFTPEQELRLPAPEVKRMYRITGSAELG